MLIKESRFWMTRLKIRLAGCFLVAGFFTAPSLLFAQGGATEDRELLQAVQNAYRANWAPLSHGVARFTIRVGSLSNPEGAPDHLEWTRQRVGRGFQAFDGRLGRYERIFEAHEEDGRVEPEDRSRAALSRSIRALTDGKQTFFNELHHQPDKKISHVVEIMTGSQPYHRILLFNLNQANDPPIGLRLDDDIDTVLSAGMTYHIGETKEYDGRSLLVFRFRGKLAEREYLIDMERGAQPRRVLDIPFEGGPYNRHFFDDLRLVENAVWVPFRMLTIIGDRSARQQEILELTAGARPPSSTFRLDFESPIAVVDAVRALRYPPRRSWSLSSLPGPASKGTERLTSSSTAAIPAPELPGVRPIPTTGSRLAWVFFPLVAAVVSLLVGYLVTQRWRRA